jgi:hypothetical protein
MTKKGNGNPKEEALYGSHTVILPILKGGVPTYGNTYSSMICRIFLLALSKQLHSFDFCDVLKALLNQCRCSSL